ncbi:hemolysin family protein [Egicoccus sp. AB-alg2]|uniref:hemolysin family protein n=1 Tax=Egicoccus sp. AB-alg2 TaxID=3242693 RepID=UPI00359D2AA4
MNVALTPLLVAGGLLLVVTALLAAMETVIDRVNVVRALRLDEEERRGAPALLWLTEHRATSLNVLLALGLTIRLTLGAVAALIGWRLDAGPGALLSVVLAIAVALVAGEVVPRTIVLRHLEASGLRLAPLAKGLVRGLDPVARGAVTLGRALVPRRHEVSGPYATDDELRQLDADGDDQDEELEPEERAMIRSIFELADTIVREIMVPRPDMVTVPEDAPLRDVVQVVLERGYSRVPVHDPDDVDTIVGVVYAKDLLRRVATEQRRERWGDLVRRPTFVPETKRCDELLRELQEATVHLAIVVDEYGEIVGLVTIEDILEEIVGEIVDEHDHEEPLVELLDDDVMRIDARLGVDDLNELLDATLPEEGWDTVGGLVFGTLGRVPVEGERLELEGLCITVERVQGRRVGKVLVSRRNGNDGRAGDSGPA